MCAVTVFVIRIIIVVRLVTHLDTVVPNVGFVGPVATRDVVDIFEMTHLVACVGFGDLLEMLERLCGARMCLSYCE